jgi:hypothetical protein
VKQLILSRAAELVEPGRSKGKFAEDQDGNYVPTDSAEAVQFCAVGALWRAMVETGGTKKDFDEALAALSSAVGSLLPLPEWSDLATDDEVEDAFRRAQGQGGIFIHPDQLVLQ